MAMEDSYPRTRQVVKPDLARLQTRKIYEEINQLKY